MIYASPQLDEIDRKVLFLLENQRDRLQLYASTEQRRWYGFLRKNTFARAIRGSNSIEGYNATMDEAMAAVNNEPPLDEATETWKAISGYRDAITYIIQAARDPYFELSKQFLKSLHFMMINYDMSKNPGQWRPGNIYVVDENSGERVYEGPEPERVDDLVRELIAYLDTKTQDHPIIKAAMAHLNLTMIHPFRDGNGRMARALQTFIIAQGGVIHPVFSSIEEWLGRNTAEYYVILAETGQGKWNPQKSALPWVKFCLKAHYQQAETLIRRHEDYRNLFEKIDVLVTDRELPDRTSISLFNAALGFRLTNSQYRDEAEISLAVASRELRRLCDEGLLVPRGDNRGRTYRGSPLLTSLWQETKTQKKAEDPYKIIARQEEERQLSLLESNER